MLCFFVNRASNSVDIWLMGWYGGSDICVSNISGKMKRYNSRTGLVSAILHFMGGGRLRCWLLNLILILVLVTYISPFLSYMNRVLVTCIGYLHQVHTALSKMVIGSYIAPFLSYMNRAYTVCWCATKHCFLHYRIKTDHGLGCWKSYIL
jgi:hypothetical protein